MGSGAAQPGCSWACPGPAPADPFHGTCPATTTQGCANDRRTTCSFWNRSRRSGYHRWPVRPYRYRRRRSRGRHRAGRRRPRCHQGPVHRGPQGRHHRRAERARRREPADRQGRRDRAQGVQQRRARLLGEDELHRRQAPGRRPVGVLCGAGSHRVGRHHPDQPDLGPGPHRPAEPAAVEVLHVRAGRQRHRVHHRHRHPPDPQRVRRPGHSPATTSSTTTPTPPTARVTAPTWPVPSAARPTAWPRTSSWSPCASWTAPATARTRRSSPASTGSPRTPSSRPWPT